MKKNFLLYFLCLISIEGAELLRSRIWLEIGIGSIQSKVFDQEDNFVNQSQFYVLYSNGHREVFKPSRSHYNLGLHYEYMLYRALGLRGGYTLKKSWHSMSAGDNKNYERRTIGGVAINTHQAELGLGYHLDLSHEQHWLNFYFLGTLQFGRYRPLPTLSGISGKLQNNKNLAKNLLDSTPESPVRGLGGKMGLGYEYTDIWFFTKLILYYDLSSMTFDRQIWLALNDTELYNQVYITWNFGILF